MHRRQLLKNIIVDRLFILDTYVRMIQLQGGDELTQTSLTSTQSSMGFNESSTLSEDAKKMRLAKAAKMSRLAKAKMKSQLARATAEARGGAFSSTKDKGVTSTQDGPEDRRSKWDNLVRKVNIMREVAARTSAKNMSAARSAILASEQKSQVMSRRKPRLMPVPKPKMIPQRKPWVEKSAAEIMGSAGPQKTAHLYDIAWAKFEEYRGVSDEPCEDDYVKYFHYLHEAKEFKSSTLWNTYAKLNSVHQRKFGNRLQLWPRLKMLLKRYNQGYKRKTASIFHLEEIKRALLLGNSSSMWIMWKAVVATAFCGGLRGCEV